MGAANIFTIGMGAIQYNAQGKIGKFNQNVKRRINRWLFKRSFFDTL